MLHKRHYVHVFGNLGSMGLFNTCVQRWDSAKVDYLGNEINV